MPDVYVYDAVRTPFGRLGGALAGSRPDDLAAAAADAVAGARLEVMAGVAHLPPAEAPDATAALLTTHLLEEHP